MHLHESEPVRPGLPVAYRLKMGNIITGNCLGDYIFANCINTDYGEKLTPAQTNIESLAPLSADLN